MKTNLAFWDTSGVVPLCCFQATSQTLRSLRRKYEVVAWRASSIEAQSALKRLLEEKQISETAYDEAVKRLEIQGETWRAHSADRKSPRPCRNHNQKPKLANT